MPQGEEGGVEMKISRGFFSYSNYNYQKFSQVLFSSYSLMDALHRSHILFLFFLLSKCNFKLRYSIIAAKFISECLQLNFISKCPFIFGQI